MVFRGATLIDGTGAPSLPNSAIVIEGGQITQVTRADSLVVPSRARVVDVTGKWIIPGLIDFHVHTSAFSNPGGERYRSPFLRPLLAYGVTTVRDTGTVPDAISQYMRNSGDPSIAMPAVFGCGPILDGQPPYWPSSMSWGLATVDEARAAVDKVADAGFWGVKAYIGLSTAVTAAIVEQAKKRGLPVTMHASSSPFGVTQAQALKLGVDGLEHAFVAIPNLSSRISLLTNRQLDQQVAGLGSAARALAVWRSIYGAWSGVDLDSPTTQQFIRSVAEAKVPWTLTLAVSERHTLLDQSDMTSTPAYAFVPAVTQASWGTALPPSRWSGDEAAAVQQGFERMLEFVGMAHAAGVRIIAGSDMPNPYVVPGASLHQELKLLVRAGPSPMDALRSATAKPAEVLGQGAHIGTLEAGKQADLVVLDGDPLKDINNVDNIVQVMRQGRSYDPAQLLTVSASDMQLFASAPVGSGVCCCA